MKKVIVAMSGGVDSSVAAALLKEQGFEVEGLFMKNWSPDDLQSLSDCPWEEDQADALAVCEHLGIPFRSINFEKEYKERVVNYFLREYLSGRTPNPDVMCNKEIKFAAFLDAAEEMGAELIATGHYVRQQDGVLLRGVDPKKDQSYFLYTLNEHQVKTTLFPVGEYTKPQIRELAEKFGLPTAKKKDSQGICFIGHIDLKEFLMHMLGKKPGSTYFLPPAQEGENLEARRRRAILVGRHEGAILYTVGERTGHAIDNRLYKKLIGPENVPVTYLVQHNVEENRLYVTGDREDVHLYARELYLEGYYTTGASGSETVESTIDALQSRASLTCQIRYQQTPVSVKKTELQEGKIKITTGESLWAVAEGQSLVLYENDVVVGGGTVCAINR